MQKLTGSAQPIINSTEAAAVLLVLVSYCQINRHRTYMGTHQTVSGGVDLPVMIYQYYCTTIITCKCAANGHTSAAVVDIVSYSLVNRNK
jgi:hypothetical protein